MSGPTSIVQLMQHKYRAGGSCVKLCRCLCMCLLTPPVFLAQGRGIVDLVLPVPLRTNGLGHDRHCRGELFLHQHRTSRARIPKKCAGNNELALQAASPSGLCNGRLRRLSELHHAKAWLGSCTIPGKFGAYNRHQLGAAGCWNATASPTPQGSASRL